MKCDICNGKIEETFLNKIIGTVIYDKKHKKRTVCGRCQSLHGKQDLRVKLE